MLTGCAQQDALLDRAMTLRAQMIANAVSFDAEITADYGDVTYTFSMNCQVDTTGSMTFTVAEPDTLAGITGTISATGGKLTFDDTALAFEMMADGQLTPVIGPWVLIKTLRSGYLTSCGMDADSLRLAIDDSYEEDALHLDIWLDGEDKPKNADIYWEGRRLLSVTVSNFTLE